MGSRQVTQSRVLVVLVVVGACPSLTLFTREPLAQLGNSSESLRVQKPYFIICPNVNVQPNNQLFPNNMSMFPSVSDVNVSSYFPTIPHLKKRPSRGDLDVVDITNRLPKASHWESGTKNKQIEHH